LHAENRTDIRGKEQELINTNFELQKKDKDDDAKEGTSGCDESFPKHVVG
jgi:hypothetical protein